MPTIEQIRPHVMDDYYVSAADVVALRCEIPADSADIPDSVRDLIICVLVLRDGTAYSGSSTTEGDAAERHQQAQERAIASIPAAKLVELGLSE